MFSENSYKAPWSSKTPSPAPSYIAREHDDAVQKRFSQTRNLSILTFPEVLFLNTAGMS